MADSIDRLYLAVCAAAEERPALSRTARLRREGVNKMAKKVVEEAGEVAIEAVTGARDAVVLESADLIYNLVVLWSATDVKPEDVFAEMDRRERLYGIAQKLPKNAAQAADEDDEAEPARARLVR